MKVEWVKCKGGVWCDLFKLDVGHKNLANLEGVYIIWTGTETKKVVRVGCGDIQNEFMRLRKDLSMQAFSHLGASVTWCVEDKSKHNYILAYIISKLNPTIIENYKPSKPVELNLPW